MSRDKIILDLCGGTGSWSKPYKEAGYTVHNITLPDFDVRKVEFDHYSMIFKHSSGKDWKDEQVLYSEIYGIFAAPPCTMFSLARSRAKEPRNLVEGMETVEACMQIIWNVRKKQQLAFWALENPVGFLRQFLGNPILTFDPYEFGDPYTKKTDIWGWFNMPKKDPCVIPEGQLKLCQQNKRPLPKFPSISAITGSKQQTRRAMTPQGFAKAFYEANK